LRKKVPRFFLLGGMSLVLLTVACGIDSAKSHFILAEKLWMDKKYSASVLEFEKVTSKDPRGELGLQAIYRAALTQTLFLGQYTEAIKKFRRYVQESKDPRTVWEAQLQIGEILFSKTEQYEQAISHYQSLLKQNPEAIEAPELYFRIGKSYFFLFQFSKALEFYEHILQQFPKSSWAEKASFEIGSTYYIRGEQQPDGKNSGSYQKAISFYEKFVRQYPKSELIPQAQFGIASCLEELDHLEEAYRAFAALEKSYPSPRVIQIKLFRIRERIAQRGQKH
jgi:TolA-binding protein